VKCEGNSDQEDKVDDKVPVCRGKEATAKLVGRVRDVAWLRPRLELKQWEGSNDEDGEARSEGCSLNSGGPMPAGDLVDMLPKAGLPPQLNNVFVVL